MKKWSDGGNLQSGRPKLSHFAKNTPVLCLRDFRQNDLALIELFLLASFPTKNLGPRRVSKVRGGAPRVSMGFHVVPSDSMTFPNFVKSDLYVEIFYPCNNLSHDSSNWYDSSRCLPIQIHCCCEEIAGVRNILALHNLR